jgi:hypothetical protein
MAREARPRYEHRQGGGITRIAFGISALLLPALLLFDRASSPATYVAAPVLLLAFLAFDGLRIRVTRDELAWRFGHLGFPRGRVALADIAAAEVTRTSFWEGWGIRRTRRGWLYNVSGYDAVLVTRRDGRTFLLGSDEPRKLKAAIEAARATRDAGPAVRR